MNAWSKVKKIKNKELTRGVHRGSPPQALLVACCCKRHKRGFREGHVHLQPGVMSLPSCFFLLVPKCAARFFPEHNTPFFATKRSNKSAGRKRRRRGGRGGGDANYRRKCYEINQVKIFSITLFFYLTCLCSLVVLLFVLKK